MSAEETKLELDAAELDRKKAEAEKFRHEADVAHWQALYNEQSYRSMKLQVDQTEDAMEWTNSSDFENRIYHMTGEINGDSAHHCVEALSRWARQGNDPVELVLTTPGGSAMDGMALFDHIMALRLTGGMTINCTVRGYAASMGAILLQAGEVRKMGPNSTILLHKIRGGVGGSLDEIEDRRDWLNIMQEQVYDIFAARCAASFVATEKLSREEIVNGMNRRDWAVGPDRARALGLIDRIG